MLHFFTTPIFNLYMNKAFTIIDAALAVVCFLQMFISLSSVCTAVFYLFFLLFYTFAVISHVILVKFTQFDVEAYQKSFCRFIGVNGVFHFVYLFSAVMFWYYTDKNPIYCALCIQYGLPKAIGLVVDIHCIICILFYATFIHSYVSRKYYLRAIGGFEIEVRRIQQLAEISNRQYILEPNYHDYPPSNSSKDKYYRFQDAVQIQNALTCPICLKTSQQKQAGKLVVTTCGHNFHRDCIENWTKISSSCPECRKELGLDYQEKKQQQGQHKRQQKQKYKQQTQ